MKPSVERSGCCPQPSTEGRPVLLLRRMSYLQSEGHTPAFSIAIFNASVSTQNRPLPSLHPYSISKRKRNERKPRPVRGRAKSAALPEEL